MSNEQNSRASDSDRNQKSSPFKAIVEQHQHNDDKADPAEKDPYDEFAERISMLGRKLTSLWLEAKKGWEDTGFHDRVSVLLAGGGLVVLIVYTAATLRYVSITHRQWEETQQQTRISQRQLEQSQRAWLKVSITADSGFEFTDDGGARMSARTHIQNIGNSVATQIVTGVKMILMPMDDASGGKSFFPYGPVKQQSEICDKITKEPIVAGKTQSDFEQLIFPQDIDESVSHGMTVSKADIDKTKKSVAIKNGTEELIVPFVIGCVDYQFATATQHHQTGFIYVLQHHDRTLPPNIYPIRAIRVGHSIAASDVEIQKWAFGGFYAY